MLRSSCELPHPGDWSQPRDLCMGDMKWVHRFTYLLRGDRLLRGLVQLLNGLGVVAEILLASNQDDGKALAEVKNLGDPL